MKKFLSLFLFLIPVFLFAQTANELFFSEYCEGSGNNKYIEIYNGTGSTVTLTNNYKIWKISNGGDWFEYELVNFDGTIANNDVYVIYSTSTEIDTAISNAGDQTWAQANFNGNDALALVKTVNGIDTIIDVIGTNGPDIGTGWAVAGTDFATKNHTLVRKANVHNPNPNWASSAGTTIENSEWTVYDENTFAYVGTHDIDTTVEPGITLLSFNGGEVLFLENSYQILWSTNDILETEIVNISLRYNYVNSSTYSTYVITENTIQNTGSFDWQLATNTPKCEDAKIFIEIGQHNKISNEAFSIYGTATEPLIINEIMYNSSYEYENTEFIEIFNSSNLDINLAGYKLIGNSFKFDFSNSSQISANSYEVLANSLDSFTALYQNISPIGVLNNTISASSDMLLLINPQLDVIDIVSYQNSNPFPAYSNSTGSSIELKNPSLDNNNGENWQDSYKLNGTPTQQNSQVLSPQSPIVINEIMYNPPTSLGNDTDFEYIEIYNYSENDIDISNWKIKVGTDFTFAENTTLTNHEYLVVALNPQPIIDTYQINNVVGPLGNNLNNTSELLRLYDANNQLIDWVKYYDSDPWDSNADGLGASLELQNPLSDNSLAENWLATTPNGSPGAVNNLVTVHNNQNNVNQNKKTLTVCNYPNPFNPTTTIKLNVFTKSKVKLDIYNLKGQIVKTLFNGTLQKGIKIVKFNGLDKDKNKLSSGIYFYKVSTPKCQITKKILLLK